MESITRPLTPSSATAVRWQFSLPELEAEAKKIQAVISGAKKYYKESRAFLGEEAAAPIKMGLPPIKKRRNQLYREIGKLTLKKGQRPTSLQLPPRQETTAPPTWPRPHSIPTTSSYDNKELPDEVLLAIFRWLPKIGLVNLESTRRMKEVASLSLVCKQWARVASDNDLWRPFLPLFQKEQAVSLPIQGPVKQHIKYLVGKRWAMGLEKGGVIAKIEGLVEHERLQEISSYAIGKQVYLLGTTNGHKQRRLFTIYSIAEKKLVSLIPQCTCFAAIVKGGALFAATINVQKFQFWCLVDNGELNPKLLHTWPNDKLPSSKGQLPSSKGHLTQRLAFVGDHLLVDGERIVTFGD